MSKSSRKRVSSIVSSWVKDILCRLVAETQGHIKDIDTHGMRPSQLAEIIEYQVSETTKLKTMLLEMPKEEDTIQ